MLLYYGLNRARAIHCWDTRNIFPHISKQKRAAVAERQYTVYYKMGTQKFHKQTLANLEILSPKKKKPLCGPAADVVQIDKTLVYDILCATAQGKVCTRIPIKHPPSYSHPTVYCNKVSVMLNFSHQEMSDITTEALRKYAINTVRLDLWIQTAKPLKFTTRPCICGAACIKAGGSQKCITR